MAGILDFQLPDYSRVGQGVQRADIPEIPSIPEQGFLGQAVADDIQARKNFRNQQVPSPLMMEDPNAALLPEAPIQPLDVAAAPVVTPQPQAAVIQPQVQADRGIAYTPQAEAPVEDNEVKQAYTEGKKQAAMAIGEQDEIAARQKNIQDLQAQKDKAFEESRLKGQEVDAELAKMEPKDYWADKSTGSKIAAAIAMGMGAYASAMTGTQNGAMQIINDAISRDLNLQKEKYQRAKERGASIKSVYADTVARLGDKEAAELTLTNMAYKKIDMKLAAQQAATQNQVQQLNIQKMRQEIAQSQQAMEAKRAEIMAISQLQSGKKAGKVDVERLPEQIRQRYVDDDEFSGIARSFDEAKDFRKSLPDYKDTMNSLNRLLELSKIEGKSITPKIRGEIEQIKALLGGTMREAVLGPGTVTEQERSIMQDQVIGNPAKFMGFDSIAQDKIRNLANKIQTKKMNQAQAIGLIPSIKAAPTNTVQVKLDGQMGSIPRQNLEAFVKAQKAQGRKVEVLGE